MTKHATTSRTNATKAGDATIDKPVRSVKQKVPRGQHAAASSKTKLDAAPDATITPATKPPRHTKAAMLRARLSEPGGVSLAALVEATGWQAHTLRAALSGLRKTGLTITRRCEGTDTIYAIEATGADATPPQNLDVSADAVPPAVPAGSAA